ncbi:MAG: biotin transporter BioY [Chloroflexi bacterium]|nr:biotin transporter BioY [Chloroflexota bacterium]
METAGTRRTVMIEALWLRSGVAREVALVLGGSLLIALSAQLRLVLPFSPVPISGQTFAVLLLGALYGSRRGPATVMTYLALGAVGLPIGAGGALGVAWLLGPTGGYLVGFAAAAYVVGTLSERGWDRKPWTTAASMIIGNAIIYVGGIVWLSKFVGWQAVLGAGFYPFLVGDAFKIALATILLPAGWKFIGRSGQP